MKTVLVVEDEILVMNLLLHLLRHYTVLAATTAEQALRVFNEHAHQIDLLVAEVALLTGSGILVARFLRSERPGLPVILTSGCPLSRWDFLDLEKLGSDSVLTLPKPFKGEELLSAVRQLIGPRSSAATPE
jgi:two-component system cell cycle sensor histidine kinase/response regulator CckA